jgi:hypothetical protein
MKNRNQIAGRLIVVGLLVAWLSIIVQASGGSMSASKATIVYDRIASEVSATIDASNDLWITPADLTKATRFEIKPAGVCRDELCFPLPKANKQSFVKIQDGQDWFNLSAFARLVHQPLARDEKHSIWLFGERQTVQNGFLTSLAAPDFTLPDINGKMHSLSNYRGKKVLIVTWASW